MNKITLLSFETVTCHNYSPLIFAIDVLETLHKYSFEMLFKSISMFSCTSWKSSNLFPFKRVWVKGIGRSQENLDPTSVVDGEVAQHHSLTQSQYCPTVPGKKGNSILHTYSYFLTRTDIERKIGLMIFLTYNKTWSSFWAPFQRKTSGKVSRTCITEFSSE